MAFGPLKPSERQSPAVPFGRPPTTGSLLEEALATLRAIDPTKLDTIAGDTSLLKIKGVLTARNVFDVNSRSSMLKLKELFEGALLLGYEADVQPSNAGDRLLCQKLDQPATWSPGGDPTGSMNRALDRVRELLSETADVMANEDAAFALLSRVVKATTRTEPPNP